MLRLKTKEELVRDEGMLSDYLIPSRFYTVHALLIPLLGNELPEEIILTPMKKSVHSEKGDLYNASISDEGKIFTVSRSRLSNVAIYTFMLTEELDIEF